MGLVFGNRPFEFSDFFALIEDGEIDFSKLDFVEIVKKNIEAGFRHIEITGDLIHVLPGILSPEIIQYLVKIKEKTEITFSIHLPLWAVEPAAFLPHIRKASIEAFVECIELTKPLDPLCWVIHPTGTLTVEFMNMNLPHFARDLMMQQFTGHAAEAIKQIIEKTGIPSRKIAVENIEYPFSLIIQIIEKLDLSICFDTGHLLAGYSGEIGVIDFIETYYDRIVELHLHDGKYPKIDHKTLGDYDLPVRKLLLKLIERNFKGPLIYELNFEEALKSMEYVKTHVPEAFKQ